jgi:hypothetical protein
LGEICGELAELPRFCCLSDQAFPDGELLPTKGAQLFFYKCVPLLVAFDLVFPEFLITLWPFKDAAQMPMPEATVHEDDGSVSREDEIRFAWQSLAVKPEAKALRVQGLPYLQFGSCILSADASHHPASGCPVDNVSH